MADSEVKTFVLDINIPVHDYTCFKKFENLPEPARHCCHWLQGSIMTDNGIGLIPVDVDQKLSHWMKPVFDNLEIIVKTPTDRDKDQEAAVSIIRATNILSTVAIFRLNLLLI